MKKISIKIAPMLKKQPPYIASCSEPPLNIIREIEVFVRDGLTDSECNEIGHEIARVLRELDS